jgi:hypothetical protein
LTKREVVQNLLPSSKELLPIFGNFLKNQSGQEITSSFSNQDLTTLKNNFIAQEKLSVIRGLNKSTKRYFVMENQNMIDSFANIWPDGRIKLIESISEGDGTVLSESANVNGATIIDLPNLNHGEIISTKTGISAVLNAANVEHTEDQIVDNPVPTINQAILLLLKSPAKVKITDLQTGLSAGNTSDSKILNSFSTDDQKLVFVPTENGKTYSINVVGIADGFFELDLSSISESTSSSQIVFADVTRNSQINNYQISYHEKANLISTQDILPENSAVSLETEFDNLNSFVSSSSASLEIIDKMKQTINDLKADAILIRFLVEKKNSSNQAIQQILKMISKTFILNVFLRDSSEQEQFEYLAKFFDILKTEKLLFSVVNKNAGQATFDKINFAANFRDQMINSTQKKVENEILNEATDQIQIRFFNEAKEIYGLSEREYESLLYGEAYISLQIGRFLLFESLK